MVYLVWFKAEGRIESLIGVWPDEEAAREQSYNTAVAFANGSGIITESMMGDCWEVANRERMAFRIRFDALPFGKVDN